MWRVTMNEPSKTNDLKIFFQSKMKNEKNPVDLNMLIILSGDIILNPRPVNRHQIKDHRYLPGKDSISFTLILTVLYQK